MTRWIDVNVVVSESQHPKVSMAQSLKNPEPLESFFMAKSSMVRITVVDITPKMGCRFIHSFLGLTRDTEVVEVRSTYIMVGLD